MSFDSIRQQLSRNVPFARLLGIEIESLDGKQALVRAGAREPLSNHLGTMHGGALFTICETASGAALAGALPDVILQTRCVVKQAQIDYLRPAAGDVNARARLVDEAATLMHALRRRGSLEVAVDVIATSYSREGDETPVARASFNWHLRLQTP